MAREQALHHLQYRQLRDAALDRMVRGLSHVRCAARRVEPAAIAAEGQQLVVPALAAAKPQVTLQIPRSKKASNSTLARRGRVGQCRPWMSAVRLLNLGVCLAAIKSRARPALADSKQMQNHAEADFAQRGEAKSRSRRSL
jgi:hypothetical protein